MLAVIALQSMFEGLYMQALEPQGAFKDRLREKGFDLDHQRTSYPVGVWVACLDVTSAELYPGQPRAAAWQQIGYRFVEGYFRTLVGRMIASMLPFMSPKRFMGRVPGFITTGLQGASMTIDWQGANQVLIRIDGVHGSTSVFLAGVLEACFARMKLKGVHLEPRETGAIDSELLVTLP
ncbi:MAG: DUF2378 family protein [Archangium sp.]|nr:DUF2378 family protein [Archangium sp.]MDP3575541.1 DUF2378 family protein [Archangium sp.]